MRVGTGATAARPELAVDPAARDRLAAALDVVLAASDSISNCVKHFNTLPADQDPPASWVDRATDLHLAFLEAWWALDDEAAIDAAAGGWTVGPPHAIGTPVERRRIRTTWEAEWFDPPGLHLWWDKLVHDVDDARSTKEAEAAGRALIAEGAKRRYAGWHEHATREATNA